MRLLKNSLLLATLLIVGLSSCKKDDCEAPVISENIIGTWEGKTTGEEAEFKADGTMVDPNGAVLEGATSFVVDSTTLKVTATESGSSFSINYDVTQNECDEIKLSVLGIEETFTRK